MERTIDAQNYKAEARPGVNESPPELARAGGDSPGYQEEAELREEAA
jgi:hypothetical protein